MTVKETSHVPVTYRVQITHWLYSDYSTNQCLYCMIVQIGHWHQRGNSIEYWDTPNLLRKYTRPLHTYIKYSDRIWNSLFNLFTLSFIFFFRWKDATPTFSVCRRWFLVMLANSLIFWISFQENSIQYHVESMSFLEQVFSYVERLFEWIKLLKFIPRVPNPTPVEALSPQTVVRTKY